MWLVDLVFPVSCAACGGAVADSRLPLCERCHRGLAPIPAPVCGRCGAPTAWAVERCLECAGRRLAFASARAATPYSGAARSLVHAWKERGLRRGAVLAAELIAERVTRPDADAIVFVPAHDGRLLERGHHPPERLALALAELWSIEAARLLARRGGGGRQAGRTREERRAGVRGVFRARGEVPAAVVLVDDVYTTGSTAAAAASALRRGGARRVDVVTFARAIR